jgi:hypothetical protein
MLRQQLVSALGRELTPVDFAAYVNFHSRLLYKDAYCPRQFSYPVRRKYEILLVVVAYSRLAQYSCTGVSLALRGSPFVLRG